MIKKIEEFVLGEKIQGTFVNGGVKKGVTSNTNATFLTIELRDITGSIEGKMWDAMNEALNDQLEAATLIRVEADVTEYRGALQLRINHAKPMDINDPSINIEEIVPVAPIDLKSAYAEMLITFEQFKNNDLKKVGMHVLTELKEPLMRAPAAMKNHHAVRGGLLWHVRGMMRLADSIGSLYPEIDMELLKTGVLLHDIAKPGEYILNQVDIVTDYSDRGKLVGHIPMGITYVNNICRQLAVDEQINSYLQHLVASHHGKKEYGSPVEPLFLEAEILHLIDMIDARVNTYSNIHKDLEPNAWSERIFGLGGKSIINVDLDALAQEKEEDGVVL